MRSMAAFDTLALRQLGMDALARGIGLPSENVAIQLGDRSFVRDTLIRVPLKEPLGVLLGIRDLPNELANRRPSALELLDPTGASGVGLALEHVSIQLVDDPPSVRRAWLLSHREGGSQSQRQEQNRCAEHGHTLLITSQAYPSHNPCRRASYPLRILTSSTRDSRAFALDTSAGFLPPGHKVTRHPRGTRARAWLGHRRHPSRITRAQHRHIGDPRVGERFALKWYHDCSNIRSAGCGPPVRVARSVRPRRACRRRHASRLTRTAIPWRTTSN